MHGKEWTKEELGILNDSLSKGMNHKEIGDILSRSKSSITNYCHRFQLKSKLSFGERIYFHNENYFSKKTLENCYWAGILMADGCVYKDKNKYNLCWSAAIKDGHLIERFAKDIQYTGPIKDGITNGGKWRHKIFKGGFPYKKIILHGATQIIEDLKHNFGVTETKTYRNVVQNFESKEQELAFLIGLLDGDGCISLKNKGEDGIAIKLVSSSIPTLEWFESLVIKMKLPKTYVNLSRKIIKIKGENCYLYEVGGVEACFLYKELLRIPVKRLARKWDSEVVVLAVKKKLEKWDASSLNPENKVESLNLVV